MLCATKTFRQIARSACCSPSTCRRTPSASRAQKYPWRLLSGSKCAARRHCHVSHLQNWFQPTLIRLVRDWSAQEQQSILDDTCELWKMRLTARSIWWWKIYTTQKKMCSILKPFVYYSLFYTSKSGTAVCQTLYLFLSVSLSHSQVENHHFWWISFTLHDDLLKSVKKNCHKNLS